MQKNINSKSNPFKIPEDYFIQLEKNVCLKTIEKNNSKNPYITPINYFENLEDKILLATSKNDDKSKNILVINQKIYWIAAAACLFLAVSLGIYLMNIPFKNQSLPLAKIQDQSNNTISDNLYMFKNEDSAMSSNISSKINSEKEIITTNNLRSSKITKARKQKPTKQINENVYEHEVVTSSNVIYDLYLTNDEVNNLYDEEMYQDIFILF